MARAAAHGRGLAARADGVRAAAALPVRHGRRAAAARARGARGRAGGGCKFFIYFFIHISNYFSFKLLMRARFKLLNAHVATAGSGGVLTRVGSAENYPTFDSIIRFTLYFKTMFNVTGVI